MKRNVAGEKVEAGFYWNLKTLEIVSVLEGTDRVLPGNADEKYVRLPALGALTVAPLLGVAFIVVFPLIGFGVFFGWAGLKVARAAEWSFMEVATVLAPRWEPGVAYFAGKKKARIDAKPEEKPEGEVKE